MRTAWMYAWESIGNFPVTRNTQASFAVICLKIERNHGDAVSPWFSVFLMLTITSHVVLDSLNHRLIDVGNVHKIYSVEPGVEYAKPCDIMERRIAGVLSHDVMHEQFQSMYLGWFLLCGRNNPQCIGG